MKHLTPTVTLYERKDWLARAWKSYATQLYPTVAYLHHSTDKLAEHAESLSDQETMCRAIQRYHMDTNGWDDIGYHFLVFQTYGSIPYARIFEGRPMSHVPAAQAGHNTGTIAICVVGNFDHDDRVRRNTRYAIEMLLRKWVPQTVSILGGHRDVVNTKCPGDTLYAEIPRIAQVTGKRRYGH